MTSDELLQLIAKNEGQHIEFKLESEKQADLAEVLSVPSTASPQPLEFRVNQPWYSQHWAFASGTQQRI